MTAPLRLAPYLALSLLIAPVQRRGDESHTAPLGVFFIGDSTVANYRVEPRLAAALIQPVSIPKAPPVEARVSYALTGLNATMRATPLPKSVEPITKPER